MIKDDQSRVGGRIGIERIVELGSVLDQHATPAIGSPHAAEPGSGDECFASGADRVVLLPLFWHGFKTFSLFGMLYDKVV